MSECNEELQASGKPYPRTCAICGLGPCKEGYLKGVTAKAAPTKIWVVESMTGKKVAVLSEARAMFLADLMDGKHEEIAFDATEPPQ